MTLTTVNLDQLVRKARAAGLDGGDRGAVRRLVWNGIRSDAVDHDVIDAVVDRLPRTSHGATPVPVIPSRRRGTSTVAAAEIPRRSAPRDDIEAASLG